MEKIKKGLKLIICLIGLIAVVESPVFSFTLSNDNLRLAVGETDDTLGRIRDATLEELVTESNILSSFELEGVGALIKELKDKSAGVMDMREFLNKYYARVRGGYSLGLSSGLSLYLVFSRALGLADWQIAYKEYGIAATEDNHTAKFLQKLVESNSPIVFFVPNNMWDRGVTRDEMNWIARHLNEPGKLKNIFFVFGAYNRYFSLDLRAKKEEIIGLHEFEQFLLNYIIKDVTIGALKDDEKRQVEIAMQENVASYDHRKQKADAIVAKDNINFAPIIKQREKRFIQVTLIDVTETNRVIQLLENLKVGDITRENNVFSFNTTEGRYSVRLNWGNIILNIPKSGSYYNVSIQRNLNAIICQRIQDLLAKLSPDVERETLTIESATKNRSQL
jgi:hypothetical protein